MYSIGSGASESSAAVIDRAGAVIDQARTVGRKLAGRALADASDPFAEENARLRSSTRSFCRLGLLTAQRLNLLGHSLTLRCLLLPLLLLAHLGAPLIGTLGSRRLFLGFHHFALL